MTDKTRYETIKVDFAGVEFISIRLDGIDYYPVTKINEIEGFQFPDKNHQDYFKRILGKDFNFLGYYTNISKRKVNCITHDQLAQLVTYRARKDNNTVAWILLESSFNTELKRANDHERGEAMKEECYQQWRDERAKGIERRRMFTDAIKLWGDLGNSINYAYITIDCYRYTGLIKKYNAWKTLYETRSERAKNPFRCTLDSVELREIADWETTVAKRMNKAKCSPELAVKWTRENL